MTTELWMLFAATGLYFVQILAAAMPTILMKGPGWAMGPRDEEGQKLPAWIGRLERAVNNMQENLLIFALVVLVAHGAGASTGTSALGAQIFLAARVAHPVFYAAGITGLRTASWVVGLVGTAMVATAVFA